MSLYESPSFNDLPEPDFLHTLTSPVPTPEPVFGPVARLSEALSDLLVIRKTEPAQRGGSGAVVFTGQLIGSAESLYDTLVSRFGAIGYTPMLERYHDEDVVIALPGLIRARTRQFPWWLHLGLLIVTAFSTIASGAQFAGYPTPRIIRALFTHFQPDYLLEAARAGLPFAFTLMLILGVHEMGHYTAARRHGVNVTLPFFIPLPIIGVLGTLGAVIFIRSPFTNRKSLFDVGISGPLAGFVVALPAFVIGLLLPAFSRPNSGFAVFRLLFSGEGVFQGLGMPPLLQWAGSAVIKGDLTRIVVEHPVALAAWFGVLLTVLNLLPIGQLDGGHVMYTLFGRFAWVIAVATFAGLVFLGLTVFSSFLFYAVLALLSGLRHPPPGNDITPLDPVRKVLGVGTIGLFLLIVTTTPFIIRG